MPPDLITEPGFYPDMDTNFYHSDPVVVPSLSSSLAKRLLDVTPRKVMHEHPRYVPHEEQSPSRTAEIGTAAHKLLMGRGKQVHIIDAKAYTNKDAQAQRAMAYETGLAPILKDDYAKAEKMAAQAQWQVNCAGINFDDLQPEVVIIWQDPRGCWCRTMLDLVDLRTGLVIDYKTTAQEVGPHNVGKYIDNSGYHLQAAFIRRGLQVLRPDLAGRIRFLNLIQDQEAPFECIMAEHSAEMQHIADQKISVAIGLWAEAQRTGIWPTYTYEVVTAYPPGYAETQWTERALSDPAITRLPHDPFHEALPSVSATLDGALVP